MLEDFTGVERRVQAEDGLQVGEEPQAGSDLFDARDMFVYFFQLDSAKFSRPRRGLNSLVSTAVGLERSVASQRRAIRGDTPVVCPPFRPISKSAIG